MGKEPTKKAVTIQETENGYIVHVPNAPINAVKVATDLDGAMKLANEMMA